MKSLKTIFNAFYVKQMFFPGFPGLFFNPFYFARKGLALHIKRFGPQVAGKTLDIGCGSKPYQSLFKSSQYIGIELDSEKNRNYKRADVF